MPSNGELFTALKAVQTLPDRMRETELALLETRIRVTKLEKMINTVKGFNV